MEKGRTEAFSDGVFSIAITLLIVEIRSPPNAESSAAELARGLVDLWPSYLAFAASFVTILVIWVNHHGLFLLLRRVDRAVLFANGLLLMAVTFIPFPTMVLARHLMTPAAKAAAAFYCLTFLVVNLSFHLLLWVAARERAADTRILHDDILEEAVHRLRRVYLLGTLGYVAAVAVSWVHGLWGTALCSLLWAVWARLDYGGMRGKDR
jgi:uncharacterized membrane protein